MNINDYIGKPYLVGARGPDSYDCWGLVCAIYKEGLGVDLPDWHRGHKMDGPQSITFFRDKGLRDGVAVEVDTPEDFSIALLDRGKIAHHAGVYYGGGIVHCNDALRGSRFDRINYFGPVRFFNWQL